MGLKVNSRAKYASYLLLFAIFFYGCQSPVVETTTLGEAEVELNQTFIDGQYIVVFDQKKAKLNMGDESAIDRTRLQIMEESAVTPVSSLKE